MCHKRNHSPYRCVLLGVVLRFLLSTIAPKARFVHFRGWICKQGRTSKVCICHSIGGADKKRCRKTHKCFLSQLCRKLLGVRHSFALVVGSLAELSFLVWASNPTYCLILLTIQQLFALGARLEKHGAPMGGDSLPNADSTLRSSEAAFPSLVSIGLHAALLPLSTRRSATAILLH